MGAGPLHRLALRLAAPCALLWAIACTGASHDSTRQASSKDGEPPAGDDGSSGDTRSDPATGTATDSDEGFAIGQPPVPITGVNLVDFDNARIRCDYRHTTADNLYEAQCVVVVRRASGEEVRATEIKAGVDLSWMPPQAVRGSMTFTGCGPSTNELAFNCKVKVNDPRVLAEAVFTLQVSDQLRSPRAETSTLLLPYSVGIAAGFVPGMPYQYQGQTQPAASSLALASDEPAKVGYQQLDFPTDRASFIFPPAICLRGDDLYFVSGFSIYQVSGGRARLYAGSGSTRNIGNMSHRLRAYLGPLGIACTADAVFVSSPELGRIFKLGDDGSIEAFAGTGEIGDADDGSIAAQSPIGHPGSIAIDSKGRLIFVELETSRVRAVTPQGRLATLVGPAATPDIPPLQIVNIAVGPDDSIYIPDAASHVVYQVDSQGKVLRIAGTGQARFQQPSDPLTLSEPFAVAVDRSGEIYIGEAYRGIKKLVGNNLTQVVSAGPDLDTSTVEMLTSIFSSSGKGRGSPYLAVLAGRPEFAALAIAADGTIYTGGPDGIYAAPAGSDTARLIVGTRDTQPADCRGDMPAHEMRFFEASALTVTPDKQIVVLDWLDIRSDQMVVRRLSSRGGDFVSRTIAGCDSEPLLSAYNPTFVLMGQRGPIVNLGGITPAKDGSLLIANMAGNRIVRLDAKGVLSNFAGTGASATSGDGVPASTASFQSPAGGAFDANGNFYFIELGPMDEDAPPIGSKLRKISSDGMLTTVAGTDGFGDSKAGESAKSAPFGGSSFALAADGRIFYSEPANNKIKMIDRDGKIRLIAGGGTRVSDTDAIPALDAALSVPISLAMANDGTIYFVNFLTSQILQAQPRASDGAYEVSTFFGVKRTADCGTARVEGTTASGQLIQAIKNSLSIICEGAPRAVSIYDTCPAEDGDTRIVITQTVGAFANIIEVVRPCTR